MIVLDFTFLGFDDDDDDDQQGLAWGLVVVFGRNEGLVWVVVVVVWGQNGGLVWI
jgi:hypothetical protein